MTHRPAPVAALALASLLAVLAPGCTKVDPRAAEQAAATEAARKESAAAEVKAQYESARTAEQWDKARVHGSALLSQFPDSDAAKAIAETYPAVQEKATAARETARMQALWSYAQQSEKGGVQRSATIQSKERVDVDGTGAKVVQLIFRDHPSWGRSSYLVLQSGDFNCYGGCKVKVAVDGGSAKPMAGLRPKTDEAIAMFVNDDKALWKIARAAKTVSIEFPVKAGGTRTAVFETGGLDATQLPGW